MHCTSDGESDINHQDHWLRTPLYLAVIKGGHIEVVKFVSSFIGHPAIIYKYGQRNKYTSRVAFHFGDSHIIII